MSTIKKPPRHEVISIRLSEDRLELLERHRVALSEKLGRAVSIAEAAFLVFEDRAPAIDRAASRAELLRTPTASLDRIRKRWAAEQALSLAEWDVLAEYVLIGSGEERQQPPLRWPRVPSEGSYIAVLDAFEAVYRHRAQPASTNAWAYFGHLYGLQSNVEFSDTDAEARDQAVLQQIVAQRNALDDEETWEDPGNVGRCLLLAIRDEGVDAQTLDRILGPFWPTLWGLAARGHWIRHDRQPVRAAGPREGDVRHQLRLPSPMSGGDFTLSCASVDRAELVITIGFGRTRRFEITLDRYPEQVEWYEMLHRVKDEPWNGRHFSTVVTTQAGTATYSVSVRASAMRLDLTDTEWHTLRRLVAQAWDCPEVKRWLSELELEYGEQG
jgi:hypothetical protein